MGSYDCLVRRGRASGSSAKGSDESDAAAGGVVDELVRVLGGVVSEYELEEGEELSIICVDMEGVDDVLGRRVGLGPLERGFAGGGACRVGGGDAIVDIRADLEEAAVVIAAFFMVPIAPYRS